MCSIRPDRHRIFNRFDEYWLTRKGTCSTIKTLCNKSDSLPDISVTARPLTHTFYLAFQPDDDHFNPEVVVFRLPGRMVLCYTGCKE